MLKQTNAENSAISSLGQNRTKTILVSATCLLLAACGGSSGGGGNTADTQAPAITVGDQQVFADTQNNSVDLAITDNRDNVDDLAVSVTSSDQRVLSDSGLTLVVDGNDTSINLTPNTDEVGTSIVTISATDSSDNVAEATFQVDVVGNPESDTVVIDQLLNTGEDQDPLPINGIEFILEIEEEDAFDSLFNS